MKFLYRGEAICRKVVRQVAFFVSIFLPLALFGQKINVDQVSTPELAQTTVMTLMEDQQGLIWMGTRAGVSTYDGEQVINYSLENGLARNEVRALCEDVNGNVWLGHRGGGITRFGVSGIDSIGYHDFIGEATITHILRDRQDRLWFATEGSGVLRLDKVNVGLNELELIQYKGEDLSDLVFSISMDAYGNIYVLTDLGFSKYIEEEDRWEPFLVKGLPRFNQNSCLLIDSRDKIWVGQWHGGLFCYNPRTDTIEMFDMVELGLGSNFLSYLYEDREGNIWVGTYGGGFAKISSGTRIEVFNESTGVDAREIWSILQDREGNILVGSNNYGLTIYKGNRFIAYDEDILDRGDMVSSLYSSDNGGLWIGTNKGVSILKQYKSGERIYHLEGIDDEVTFIREDSQGRMWIGTKAQGVFSYTAGESFKVNRTINSGLSRKLLSALEIDDEDVLWAGNEPGMLVYDIKKGEKVFASWFTHFDDQNVSLIFADSRQQIWVGSSSNGLSLIEKRKVNGRDTLLIQEEVFGTDFTPTSMSEDDEGSLWVGTTLHGVYRVDPVALQILDTLDREDGLLDQHVNLVQADIYGNLYFGSIKGLSVLYKETGKIHNYTESSGFSGIGTRPRASTTDERGRLWFGSNNGMVQYDPLRRPHSIRNYDTRVTGIRILNKESNPVDGLRLPFRKNTLDISWTTISLDRDQLAYRYKLEGLKNDTWSENTDQCEIRYPALPPGHYTFRIATHDRDGSWDEDSASYSFIVLPHFLLRPYVVAIWVVLLFALVVAYIKIRERNLRRENIQLENKVVERTATVVAQKEELAQKNKDITDSIQYASRIQMAILPENLPYEDTFILFKPKDIVSGDFYWFTEVNGVEFFTAADCTGHGVPGAFMSIIGHNSLTRIVRELGIFDPAEILSELNKQVVNTLHHRSEFGEVYDGMDLALVAYHPEEGYLEYSGAFNPLYLIRHGELKEYKADKRAIGHANFSPDAAFTTNRIEIAKGDMIYMFSDGYADQFGGERRKKFKYNQLKQLFMEIHREKTEIQRSVLNTTIEKWRGDLEQLDDILILGRRF